MHDEITITFDRISGRLQRLATRHQSVQKGLAKLKEENTKLHENEKEFKEQIRTLNENILILKASAAPLDGKDKKEFEKSLSEYLKTIDKCMAMLKD